MTCIFLATLTLEHIGQYLETFLIVTTGVEDRDAADILQCIRQTLQGKKYRIQNVNSVEAEKP